MLINHKEAKLKTDCNLRQKQHFSNLHTFGNFLGSTPQLYYYDKNKMPYLKKNPHK